MWNPYSNCYKVHPLTEPNLPCCNLPLTVLAFSSMSSSIHWGFWNIYSMDKEGLLYISSRDSAFLVDSWPLTDLGTLPSSGSTAFGLSPTLCVAENARWCQFSRLCFHTYHHSTCKFLLTISIVCAGGSWASSPVLSYEWADRLCRLADARQTAQ